MKKLFLLLLLASTTLCWGQNKTLDDLEKERKETLEKISLTNKLLQTAQKSTKSSLNKLSLLNRQIQTRQGWINTLSREVNKIDRQILSLEREISELSRDLESKKTKYARSVQELYKRNKGEDKLLFILSAQTLSQSYRRLRYLNEYASWQKIQAQEIIRKQEEIAQKKKQLEETKGTKKTVLNERESEKKVLQGEQKNESVIASDLKKKERQLSTELKKHRQQAAALNRQIERIIEEEARRAAAEAAKEGKASSSKGSQPTRKAEKQGGYAMTPEEKKLADNFEKNRGILPFPLTGKYMIVGTFGTHQYKDLKYVQTNSNGIDIQTEPGTEAKAVFEGVVSKVFVLPGYNRSVIIRHGNYLTVYANLGAVYVKAGDKVKTRQSIGKIYSDSDDGNRTVLHFQLWKETTKLDPENWLDR